MFSSNLSISIFAADFPFFTALTYGGNSGSRIFEIIPSVKAMTVRSLGTLSPILFGFNNGYRKARLPQNGINGFIFSNSDYYFASIVFYFYDEFSLKGCRCPITL
jgi:hypothetical protein